MTAVGADIRQQLTEIAAGVDHNRLSEAESRLHDLILRTPLGALTLIAPDISTLIDRFYKNRRRNLRMAFENRLSLSQDTETSTIKHSGACATQEHAKSKKPLSEIYATRFADLRDHHIFQWATYYRDTLQFFFKNSLNELSCTGDFHAEVENIGKGIAIHSSEIFGQGFRHQTDRGLSADVAEIKSVSGLQKFLYLVISIFMDQRETIQHSRDAKLSWALASSMLTGILLGYGRTTFGSHSGWQLLEGDPRIWLPTLGFCHGSDVQNLLETFPAAHRNNDVYVTIVPTLLAVEWLAHRFHEEEIFLPRLSRLSVSQPPRLDVTLSVRRDQISRELVVSSFFGGLVDYNQPIGDALALRAAVVVARLSEEVHEWVEQNQYSQVLDADEVKSHPQNVHNFAELVHAKLDSQQSAEAASHDPSSMSRNYARDFPLEDPDFRRQFLVERHSVKSLLQKLAGSTGIHLWCSVRRSGKTTAASSLADANGRSVVIVQTMDHQPHQLEQNIFARRIREAFTSNKELAPDFFQSVVDECVLAATTVNVAQTKVVLIIDEYETLFGLISAYVNSDAGLKYMVALPLLSQMVGFAAKNLLIFMGQRPDAYLILAAQNQLSPLVRQYNFPLFEHLSGAADTEFTQFLRRVLTERLPFDRTFADVVYLETSGHPYLTVNLMVDFCDWLITNSHRLNGAPLDSAQFINFSKAHLTPAALKRSPHYEFFHTMLSEYLSERARTDEPWLSAITHVLQEIARKHPKAFSCSLNNFEKLAEPFGAAIRMSPERLLTSGSLSNFFQDKDGQVLPGVRLMARLAGSVTPHIN